MEGAYMAEPWNPELQKLGQKERDKRAQAERDAEAAAAAAAAESADDSPPAQKES
jgi:hypothetical protein